MSEKIFEQLLYLSVGQNQAISQVHRCGLCHRTDVAIRQLTIRSLNHKSIALWAKSLMMHKISNEGSGLKDNIFLHLNWLGTFILKIHPVC